MEADLSNLLEVVGHERSLILLLSLTYPDTLKQPKFTDHEMNIIKNLAHEKIHRQRILKLPYLKILKGWTSCHILIK